MQSFKDLRLGVEVCLDLRQKEHVGCARRGVEEKYSKVGALLAANALV